MLHQILYTSCMRGIKGGNDGLQIFSYSCHFKDSYNPHIQKFFSYQAPYLKPHQPMSDELVPLMPIKFSFQALEEEQFVLAQNTYLGRDYMGQNGRFGNHLSHVITGDVDELKTYPIEFFQSGSFFQKLEEKQANDSQIPDFLPPPKLLKNDKISFNHVADFLTLDRRMEHLKHMLAALFQSTKAKERLIICDEQIHIPYWIGALHYCFPLKNALQISFTTYEFDPSLSGSFICGVLPQETNYHFNSKSAFIFDFYQPQLPPHDINNDFFDFVELSFTLSPDSLFYFQHFIEEKTSYTAWDGDYVKGYAFYTLFSDGLSSINYYELLDAIFFANQYTSTEIKLQTCQRLIQETRLILAQKPEYNLSLFMFILSTCKYVGSQHLTPTLQLIFQYLSQTQFKTLLEKDKNHFCFIDPWYQLFFASKLENYLYLLFSLETIWCETQSNLEIAFANHLSWVCLAPSVYQKNLIAQAIHFFYHHIKDPQSFPLHCRLQARGNKIYLEFQSYFPHFLHQLPYSKKLSKEHAQKYYQLFYIQDNPHFGIE